MSKTKEPQLPEDILAEYQKSTARWRSMNQAYKDIQPLDTTTTLLIRQVLHPTSKQASKDVTRALIEFLCDREICTAQDIYDALGYSDKPILKRLKLFKDFGLVRRYSKKWYIATPRMYELRKRYLKHICE